MGAKAKKDQKKKRKRWNNNLLPDYGQSWNNKRAKELTRLAHDVGSSTLYTAHALGESI
jgi:hypothetical protein